MRQMVLSYANVYYPDELAFAFKPLMVIAESSGAKTIAKMDVEVTYGAVAHNATYYAHEGKVYANIDAFVRSFFTPSSFAVDYAVAASATNTYIDGVGANVDIYYTDTTDETTSLSFSCVWGAEDYGGEDSFFAFRDLRWWTHYPFTLGVYIGQNGVAYFGDGTSVAINKGINSVTPPQGAGDTIDAYTIEGGIVQSTFDQTFDITFQGTGGVVLGVARLHVDNTTQCGVYLRWVTRHGFFAYWLFEQRDIQFVTEAEKTFVREDFALYSDVYGFSNGAGVRQAMRRGRVVPLCAPLVNSFTYDYLTDLASSPLVDMYCGDDGNGVPQWMSVGVQPGTWQKTDDELQDFLINIVEPYTPVQRL